MDHLLIAPDTGRATAEDRSKDQRVLLLRHVIDQHPIRRHMHIKIVVAEMLVVEPQIHLARVAELVLQLHLAHLHRGRIHVDRIGEGIIGIGELDTQAAIFHIRIARHVQILEGSVETHLSRAASLQILDHLLHEGIDEGHIHLLRIEMQRQTRLRPHRINIAVHIRPGTVVLINAAQHQDALLFVVPFAEEAQPSQIDPVEGEVLHLQIRVHDPAVVEIDQVELARRLAGKLQHRITDDVKDIGQLDLVQVEEQRVGRIGRDRSPNVGILLVVRHTEILNRHLPLLHIDRCRRHPPHRIVEHQLAGLQIDMRVQEPFARLILLGLELSLRHQVRLEEPLLVVGPADEGLQHILLRLRFEVEVIASAQQIVIDGTHLQVHLIGRIATRQIARLEERFPHLEFRQPRFETELVQPVIILARDASGRNHREGQPEGTRKGLRILDRQQQLEIVLLDRLLGRKTDQSRHVLLHRLDQAGHQGPEGIGPLDPAVHQIRLDRQPALLRVAQRIQFQSLQPARVRSRRELEPVETDASLDVVDRVSPEIGIQGKGEIRLLVFLREMQRIQPATVQLRGKVELRLGTEMLEESRRREADVGIVDRDIAREGMGRQ